MIARDLKRIHPLLAHPEKKLRRSLNYARRECREGRTSQTQGTSASAAGPARTWSERAVSAAASMTSDDKPGLVRADERGECGRTE